MLSHVTCSVVSRTTYGGRSMVRKCIRARYSPMIPNAINCAPEKIAMIEARKQTWNSATLKQPADHDIGQNHQARVLKPIMLAS